MNNLNTPDAVSGKSVEAKVRTYDLEERLLTFAVAVIDVSEKLPKRQARSMCNS